MEYDDNSGDIEATPRYWSQAMSCAKLHSIVALVNSYPYEWS